METSLQSWCLTGSFNNMPRKPSIGQYACSRWHGGELGNESTELTRRNQQIGSMVGCEAANPNVRHYHTAITAEEAALGKKYDPWCRAGSLFF
eukprot:scaffold1136_cov146-Cylindrotheca_fusiformis.AAC.16